MSTETLTCDATASPDNWTLAAGASKVIAVASDDGNTSYINSGGVANTQQVFTFSNPSTIDPADTINFVTIYYTSKRIDGGFSVRAAADDGSNTVWGGTNGPGTSWTEYNDVHNTAPDAGSWTLTKVQNLRVRFENTIAKDGGVTYSRAVVDFTVASSGPAIPIVMHNDLQLRNA